MVIAGHGRDAPNALYVVCPLYIVDGVIMQQALLFFLLLFATFDPLFCTDRLPRSSPEQHQCLVGKVARMIPFCIPPEDTRKGDVTTYATGMDARG